MSDKAIRMVAAYSILWIGSGPTQGQNSNSLPPNVKGTNAAWHALQSKRPRDAADKADQVIEKFTTQAEKIEADLKSKNMPAPIIGKPSTDKERAEILDRGPLNDVATCYFIVSVRASALGRRTY
jgi:hypothetical protein